MIKIVSYLADENALVANIDKNIKIDCLILLIISGNRAIRYG